MSSFQQAYLEVDDGTRITFWFNPTTLKTSLKAKWETSKTVPGSGRQAPKTYLGGEEQDVTLQLLFHAESPRTGADVAAALQALYSLLDPKAVPGATVPRVRPRTVVLVWGGYIGQRSVCTSIDVTTELFDLDGTPLRALATITLGRAAQNEEGKGEPTNPTTRATHRRLVHEVAPGEDLALIAHEHYRDPTRWRRIAEENGLDDPLRVSAPTRLVVPLEDL